MNGQVYTYDKLIQGVALAYNDAATRRTQARKAKDASVVIDLTQLCNELQDTLHRYILARRVCGNETVIVR